jgi:2-dehydro-3-deoxy-D-arabinonate dehydratase
MLRHTVCACYMEVRRAFTLDCRRDKLGGSIDRFAFSQSPLRRPMLLYRTSSGPVLHTNGQWYALNATWDALVNADDLPAMLRSHAASSQPDPTLAAAAASSLAPIGSQELWAAGVTYLRSRTARMEESQVAGGGSFYDRVYHAERPEIFFKATPHRIVGTGDAMHLRRDSKWIVPEPELTLVINRRGEIVGYTAGNDLSCRDIEGENPLYLPQAKTFDRCASLGPGILVAEEPLPITAEIRVAVRRASATAFEGATTLAQMKRTLQELVGFLFRDNSHPNGCLLMTGTGIVPPDDFSLQLGDVVDITIDGIGTLSNPMN